MIRKAFVPLVALASIVALSAACGGPPSEGPAAPDPGAVAPTAPPPAPATPAPAEPPKAEAPKKAEPAVVVKDAGFQTPECVVHDAVDDVYLVSNIHGGPSAADNNGFISKVSPEGKVVDLQWIAGGANGVKLDAPKGMAIVGDTLYVADLLVVRMFDRKTGKPKGEVKPAGATFMNDLFAGSDGKIYATDSGIKVTDKGIEPTKSDSIWVIEKGKAKSIAKSEDLGTPNGVFVADNKIWIVSFGSGELYRVDEKGQKQDVVKLPKGKLDGLVAVGDTVLISSWDEKAIYRGKPGGTFEPVITDVKDPADIGYDAKRNRVLIPLFSDNSVLAYDVK